MIRRALPLLLLLVPLAGAAPPAPVMTVGRLVREPLQPAEPDRSHPDAHRHAGRAGGEGRHALRR